MLTRIQQSKDLANIFAQMSIPANMLKMKMASDMERRDSSGYGSRGGGCC
jgi:hypothetical protein